MTGRGPRGRARSRPAEPGGLPPSPPIEPPVVAPQEGGRGRGLQGRTEPSEPSTASGISPTGSSNGEAKRESPPQTTSSIGRAALRGKSVITTAQVETALIDPVTRMSLNREEPRQSEQRPRGQIESVPVTRPPSCTDKKGIKGSKIKIYANFFEVISQPNWLLHQYHVDFSPEIESRRIRVALLNMHSELFNNKKAFDGSTLYSLKKLAQEKTELTSVRTTDNAEIKITVKHIAEIGPTSPNFVHLFNIVFRRCLQLYGMTMIGRNYYDMNKTYPIEKYGFEIVLGFVTSIAAYEQRLMLCAEVSHRLIHVRTVYDLMSGYYSKDRNTFKEESTKNLIGQIVMTKYNKKTYRIDDINWEALPTDTFPKSDGTTITYIDYYKNNYNITVKEHDQPLLVSMPKQRDKRRGDSHPVLLLPELCFLTGISDVMREDQFMMRELATATRVNPNERLNRLADFVSNLNTHVDVNNELNKWDLKFSANPAEIDARVLDPEVLLFGSGQTVKPQKADWTNEMKQMRHLSPLPLGNWVLFYAARDEPLAIDFSEKLTSVTRAMGIKVAEPFPVQMRDDRVESFLSAMREYIKDDTQMAVFVLSSNRKDRYDAIKKFCCLNRPIPSQVILTKNIKDSRKVMGVMTKVAVQMNCKLGGEIWAVSIPLAKVMICGIDTYHDSLKKSSSVCAFIATVNQEKTKFFSRATLQDTHQELSNNLTLSMKSALLHYAKINGDFPEKIIIYRDGISDGQLPMVTDYELPQMIKSFDFIKPGYAPRVTCIVVKKRGNGRFFQHNGNSIGNPLHGTVIDNTVTRTEWYDFYLISQFTNQGTVNPTHYNVVYDTSGLKPDHLQMLSYKLTHMYYNWSGTIRVPALCQYAHKLAFLVGQSLHKEHDQSLCDKLFYL